MHNKNGFTLIEILITLAIFGVIINLISGINLNALERNSLQKERALIVSLLEKARSLAMANHENSDFGFCYQSGKYIIFKGDDCDQNNTDEMPANLNIASNPGTTFPSQIIFKRLSGESSEANIHLGDGTQSLDININHVGRIDW